jgi:hypothetical protein
LKKPITNKRVGRVAEGMGLSSNHSTAKKKQTNKQTNPQIVLAEWLK